MTVTAGLLAASLLVQPAGPPVRVIAQGGEYANLYERQLLEEELEATS